MNLIGREATDAINGGQFSNIFILTNCCLTTVAMDCIICGKTFTRKGSLRRYMVDVHKDVSIVSEDVVNTVNSELEAASGCQQQQEKQIG